MIFLLKIKRYTCLHISELNIKKKNSRDIRNKNYFFPLRGYHACDYIYNCYFFIFLIIIFVCAFFLVVYSCVRSTHTTFAHKPTHVTADSIFSSKFLFYIQVITTKVASNEEAVAAADSPDINRTRRVCCGVMMVATRPNYHRNKHKRIKS